MIETRPARDTSPGAAGTQRERLLNAIVDLSRHLAPHELTVAKISRRARVSSATFYELFDGREDALLAAHRLARDRLLAHVRLRPGGRGWRASAETVLRELLEALREDPAAGWMLCVQARGGGPRLRAEFELNAEELERWVQARLLARSDGHTPDLPAAALVGALGGLISRYLTTSREDRLPQLLDDALAWIGSYEIAADGERFSAASGVRRDDTVRAPGSKAPAPASRASRPKRLPRGQHGLSAGQVARSHRTRIIHATAQATLANGYADVTVTDIVAHAAVSRNVFYEHFTGKQQAFAEAQSYGAQHVLDSCVAVYFQAGDWPEGLWRVLERVLDLIAEHRALAHLQLLACYQAGPQAVRSLEMTTRSFAMFLQEGHDYEPAGARLPPIRADAIVAATLAIVQRDLARGEVATLRQRLPLLAYLALAPFTGPLDAARLVEQLAITSR
jgi:AcrR family transcriptional regulator